MRASQMPAAAARGAGRCGGRIFPGPERAEGHGGQSMLRIGGTASPGHITVFKGLKTHFGSVPVTCEPPRTRRKNKRVFAPITRYRDTTRFFQSGTVRGQLASGAGDITAA